MVNAWPRGMPLLVKGEMRVMVTVSPAANGQTVINVTPQAFPGGWEQVMEALMYGMKVAAQELAKTLARQQAAPRIILPEPQERL
jgi:hypothetical protein